MVAVGAEDGLPAWQLATDWDRVDALRIEDAQVTLVVSDDPRGVNDSPRQRHILRVDPVDGNVVSIDAYPGRGRSWPFDAIVFRRPTNTIIETIGQLDIWARCEPAIAAPPSSQPVCDHDSDPNIWLEAVDSITGEPVWRLFVEHEFRSLASTPNTLVVAVAPRGISDLGDAASPMAGCPQTSMAMSST